MSCKIMISRSDMKGADVITFDDTMIASALYKLLSNVDGAKVEEPETIIMAYKADNEVKYHFAAKRTEDMTILSSEVTSAIVSAIHKEKKENDWSKS